jgi:hypothetical protein
MLEIKLSRLRFLNLCYPANPSNTVGLNPDLEFSDGAWLYKNIKVHIFAKLNEML